MPFPRTFVVLTVLASVVVLSAPGSSPASGPAPASNDTLAGRDRQQSPPKLKWRQPRLHNPIRVELKARGDVTLRLHNDRDYRVVLPNRKRVGATRIEGGRNIVIKGGYTTLPSGSGEGDRNFTIVDGYSSGVVDGRVVHLEGIKIDGSGGGQGDGIGIKAPKAIVQLQNMRVVGLRGSTSGVHADVVQVYGGVKKLRIDRFTGASHYNGLYLRRENSPLEPPTGPTRISHTNMFGYKNASGVLPATTIRAIALGTQPADSDGGPGNDGSSTNCRLTHRVHLDDFYAKPPKGVRLSAFVFPWDRMEDEARYCSSKASDNGRRAYWPHWRDGMVSGAVKRGRPPMGDYVGPKRAGVHYKSPGYR